VPTQVDHTNCDDVAIKKSAVQNTLVPRASGAKRVWIDLDNTPHVPFFIPIIRGLEADGHTVTVTARDAFGVRSLAEYHGLACSIVGRHYGANRFVKVAGTAWRAIQLLPTAISARPQLCMSHGSRSMELVAFLLRVPSILLFDYEHARRLPLLKPAMGVAPDAISDPSLNAQFKYGLRTYSGLKEDVYALTFQPDPTILSQLDVRADEILVTIRPPATEAHYHNPESEALFAEVVQLLGETAGVRMVILPRTATSQTDFILRTWPAWCSEKKIILPDRALDGLNLVWFSDLVVSGGGTMNREAAALGVPVYSIFRGKLGAVDQDLARDGRLTLIAAVDDVRRRLRPVKRARTEHPASSDRPALRQILSAAYELMDLSRAN
jgi:uncharacterized protein